MEVPDRLLSLRRAVEYGLREGKHTLIVNLELLDLLLRGELPVGGNELPPEEVTKRLYETKKKLADTTRELGFANVRADQAEVKSQDEMYLRGNQLAAISTVLKADTPITLLQTRLPTDHALYTAAFQDAVAAVEEIIRLRRQNIQHRGIANVIANRLANYTGRTAPDELRRSREVCIEEQSYADLAASGGIVDAP